MSTMSDKSSGYAQAQPPQITYPGKLIIHFTDRETGESIADDFVADYPAGERYYLDNLPQIPHYRTEFRELMGYMPDDGSGLTRIVRYKRTTPRAKLCTVTREAPIDPDQHSVNTNDGDGFFSRRTIAIIFSVLMILSATVRLSQSMQAMSYARAVREELAKLKTSLSEIVGLQTPDDGISNKDLRDALDEAYLKHFGTPDDISDADPRGDVQAENPLGQRASSGGLKDPKQNPAYWGNAPVDGFDPDAGSPSVGFRAARQGSTPQSDKNIVP